MGKSEKEMLCADTDVRMWSLVLLEVEPRHGSMK